MRRIVLLSFCFIVVLLTSVIAHTPMSFALRYLPSIEGLKIESPSGTIWHGNAKNINWQGEKLGQINWQFQPNKLWQGKINYSLRFGRGSKREFSGKGEIGYRLSGLYVENLIASIPAENIMSYLSTPVPVTLSGMVELSVNQFQYAQPWCKSAIGSLVWTEGLVSTPLGILDLGTVITDLGCADSQLSIKGKHNTVQLAGELDAQLQQNTHYNVNAKFKPNAEFPPTMRSQLKWLGNPNQNGEYSFAYAGKLN